MKVYQVKEAKIRKEKINLTNTAKSPKRSINTEKEINHQVTVID